MSEFEEPESFSQSLGNLTGQFTPNSDVKALSDDFVPSDVQYYTILEHFGQKGCFFVNDLTILGNGLGFLFGPKFFDILLDLDLFFQEIKVEFYIPIEYDVTPHFPVDVDLKLASCDKKIGICKYSTECFPTDDLTKDDSSTTDDKDDEEPATFSFAVEKSKRTGRCNPYDRFHSFLKSGDGRYKYDSHGHGGW